MELVKVQLARTVWLFDSQELNPQGVTLYPDIYTAFIQRYQFRKFPKPEEFISGGSLYFKSGSFSFGSPIEIDVEIHSDGLVASCRNSTEAANDFLVNFTGWLSEQIGIAYPPISRKRIYRDEVVVQMDSRLESISDKLLGFSEFLSVVSKKDVQPVGAMFGVENTDGPLMTLERRIKTCFDDNRYFSSSSLPTSIHLEALAKFEEIMGA
jgi:hypothetical protein